MTKTESWSGLREFPVTGLYLELLETVQPVHVTLYGRDGRVLQHDRNVEAGYYHGPRSELDPFVRFEIETPGNEEVSWLASDGLTGTRRAFVRKAQARSLTLPGSASVGVTESVVLAAATREKIIFLADPANAAPIYLGPAGLTASTAVIVLEPGDLWLEDLAASAAWSAISTVAAQTLRVMTAS